MCLCNMDCLGVNALSLLTCVLLFGYVKTAEGTQEHTLCSAPKNTRPIIGIVAQDTISKHGKSYISATYVNYLLQAGARVVPIRGGQPTGYYDKMVSYTNGILFPGGAANFSSSHYGRTVKYVFDKAMQLNRNGDYYPLWGTCMGFQIMCYEVAGKNYLQRTDSRNITLPLEFTAEAAKSRLFGNAPKDIINYLRLEPVTQNEHQYSILAETFNSTKLQSFFNALSTNKDRHGKVFISTIEAKGFPFYAAQWHPEKNNFNWNPHYVINHGEHAVKVSQYMANFFVSEARKSFHHFPGVMDEAKNLIQNYKRVYFDNGSFFENYYFD